MLADYAGLDLVLINENSDPPVCKIMDYNKFRYEKKQKAKEARRKQKASQSELKEYRLSAHIDVGDIAFKEKNARRYLEKGDHIKLSLRFKGREMAHQDLGYEVMKDFAKRLEDVADIKQDIKQEGRVLSMILVPKKK